MKTNIKSRAVILATLRGSYLITAPVLPLPSHIVHGKTTLKSVCCLQEMVSTLFSILWGAFITVDSTRFGSSHEIRITLIKALPIWLQFTGIWHMAKPQLHMKFQPNRTRNKKVVTDLKNHIFPPDHTLAPDFLWDVDHIYKSSSDLAENRCVVQAQAWVGTHQSSDTSGQGWKSQGIRKTRFLSWSESRRKHYNLNYLVPKYKRSPCARQ